MITGGISFQPGGEDPQQKKIDPANNANGSQEGVQEAIKVLSLRLPKVVGSRAVAPGQLLNSAGSMGNPHADSIVEAVMQKFFPTNTAQTAMAPGEPMQGLMQGMQGGPQFGGDVAGPRQEPPRQEMPNYWNVPRTPQIVADLPPFQIPDWFGSSPTPKYPDMATIDGGWGPFPGMVEPPLQNLPDLRQQLNWLPQPPQREETPLI